MKSVIPRKCPTCFNKLIIKENKSSGSIGLYCVNDLCAGAAVKKLQKGIEQLDIKRIGLSTSEKLFKAGIEKIEDIFDKTKFNRMKLINSGEFKKGKTLEIVVKAVDDINNLELKRIVNSLNITDVGSSISEQIARYMANLNPDFSNLNKDAVSRMTNIEHPDFIRLENYIKIIENCGIDIVHPKELSSKIIKIEMTGKTDPFYKSKQEFLNVIADYGYVHHKLNKECDILVTNDLNSTTGKMAKASKMGVETKTYEQILQDLGLIK